MLGKRVGLRAGSLFFINAREREVLKMAKCGGGKGKGKGRG
jgi:hypothetical protein